VAIEHDTAAAEAQSGLLGLRQLDQLGRRAFDAYGSLDQPSTARAATEALDVHRLVVGEFSATRST